MWIIVVKNLDSDGAEAYGPMTEGSMERHFKRLQDQTDPLHTSVEPFPLLPIREAYVEE